MQLMQLSRKSAIVPVILTLAAGAAIAGTTGAEFGNLYNILLGWTTGFLGKAMAFAAFLFGAGYGVANQTIVPAVLGIVFALVFAIGPGVIQGMMTALI